jgi:hypothetical protein
MTFANGIKKAGTFKENVLMELITDPELILKHETLHGKLPEEFKQDLVQFIEEHNPTEDQTNFLKKELKVNEYEEKT